MMVEPIGETAGFPFLHEGLRTQLQPLVVMLMALDEYFHHVWLTRLASDPGGRFSRAQLDSAQAAFLSPRRGSPAACSSQDLGNATAGTTQPLQLCCGFESNALPVKWPFERSILRPGALVKVSFKGSVERASWN